MAEETNKELSNLSMTRVECPKCGAIWINGDHRWSGTGMKGSNIDLAGLVCNTLGDATCINPAKGQEGGDTWEKRLEFLDKGQSEEGESL
jgi:hypothetical protein